MINPRRAMDAVLCATLAAGCAAAPQATSPVTQAPLPSAPSTPTTAPAGTASATLPPLGEGAIAGGTYRLIGAVLGSALPSFELTIPPGWTGGTWNVDLVRDGEATVAVSFWNVAMVYRDPCQWKGTLFDPGPTAAELAAALVDIPLRNTTQPTDVTLAGLTGKHLEWSVPTTIEFSKVGNPAPSAGCDADGGGTAFYSFTGRGMGSNRYQQGPGQLDRLWILDVDGGRVVIDAFSMPTATPDDIQQLLGIVSSIKLAP